MLELDGRKDFFDELENAAAAQGTPISAPAGWKKTSDTFNDVLRGGYGLEPPFVIAVHKSKRCELRPKMEACLRNAERQAQGVQLVLL